MKLSPAIDGAYWLAVLLSLAAVAAAIWPNAAAADDPPTPSPELVEAYAQIDRLSSRVHTLERKDRKLRGHLRDYGRWVRTQRRTVLLLRRSTRISYQVKTALAIACAVYPAHCSTLRRKIRCESGNWPFAKNPHSTASGLGQFLDSTWASTPFGRLSVFDPYANALGVGWMHEVGRGGEWVCR